MNEYINSIDELILQGDFSEDTVNMYRQFIDMCRNINNFTNEEITDIYMQIVYSSIGDSDTTYTAIKEAMLGDFREFIADESNIYGKTN